MGEKRFTEERERNGKKGKKEKDNKRMEIE